MTDIATIFAGLVTRLGGTLYLASAGYKRIPNPYDLPKNNGRILEQGWGLSVAPGIVNTSRFVCSTRSIQVQFQLSLTRRYYAVEHDSVGKADSDIALLGDFETFIDDSHKNNLAVAGLAITSGAFGIQNVFAEDAPYRALISNFTVEYFRRT